MRIGKDYKRRRMVCAIQALQCATFPKACSWTDGRCGPCLAGDLVEPGRFYLDRKANRVFLGEDPARHVVEETVSSVAFEGTAPFMSNRNITIEEYGPSAEQGAIQAQTRAARWWTIEGCEVRLNSGGGIAVGDGAVFSGCSVHDNGQIGITGVGDNIRIRTE